MTILKTLSSMRDLFIQELPRRPKDFMFLGLIILVVTVYYKQCIQ
jgi:hypothetical protein